MAPVAALSSWQQARRQSGPEPLASVSNGGIARTHMVLLQKPRAPFNNSDTHLREATSLERWVRPDRSLGLPHE